VLRMSRAIRSVLGAAAVMFGGVLLAQPKGAPAPTPTDNLFPTKVKTKWTYKVGDNFVDVAVSKMEKVNNEEQYQFDTTVGKEAKTTEMFVVRADGVYRTKVKEDKLDPYVKILPLPAKEGTSWDVNSKLGTQTVKGTLKVVKAKDPVTIKTPAGDVSYDAVLVEGKDLDIAGAKTTVRIWFAKDRGIVKEEFVLQTGDKVTLELSKFVPADEGK
jgi:hypothetical protein